MLSDALDRPQLCSLGEPPSSGPPGLLTSEEARQLLRSRLPPLRGGEHARGEAVERALWVSFFARSWAAGMEHGSEEAARDLTRALQIRRDSRM